MKYPWSIIVAKTITVAVAVVVVAAAVGAVHVVEAFHPIILTVQRHHHQCGTVNLRQRQHSSSTITFLWGGSTGVRDSGRSNNIQRTAVSNTDSISSLNVDRTNDTTMTDQANSNEYTTSLIPRHVLFGNPKYTSPIVSPDGNYLAYIAPSQTPDSNNVLNVFVVQLQHHPTNTTTTSAAAAVASTATSTSTIGLDIEYAKQVTNDTKRGIRTIIWGENSKHLLYLQDNDGDENFHCYMVDIPQIFSTSTSDDTTTTSNISIHDLTPGRTVKVSSVLTNPNFPNEILLTTNERNVSQFDVYRCSLPPVVADIDDNINNIHTHTKYKMEMIEENPGNVIGWNNCNTDKSLFTVRSRTVRNPIDSSNTIQIRTIIMTKQGTPTVSEWKDLITYPFGEEGNFIDFIPSSSSETDEGQYGYITSSINYETKALLKVNVNTGSIVQEMVYNPKCDVSGVTLDRTTKAIKSVSFNYARLERMYMNDTYNEQMDYLVAHPPSQLVVSNISDYEISVVSRTRDETIWIVLYSCSNGPGVYVLYNSITNMIQSLFVNRPDLVEYTLQPMEDVRIVARDGLELVGYLTRAATVIKQTTDCESNDKEKLRVKQQPLVLLVHGGPWARDVWSYNANAQWLSNRGYHVLQVNYRGSTGYGKSFLHKGDKQWGIGTMQHDLTDSVQWAIDQGFVDPKKVCIYGGSYGGYACLAGLTFTPHLYACGVDIVGPSNVKTLLDSIPPYWGPIRNGMLLKIGNVDDDVEFNQQISPLFHIDNICSPLLIGQGANDPRVKQSEADQIAFRMYDKNIPVEYVLYPDEGHGFVRPENRIDFNGRAELFLSKHLGGRYEVFVPPIGSTATFPLLERTKYVVGK